MAPRSHGVAALVGAETPVGRLALRRLVAGNRAVVAQVWTETREELVREVREHRRAGGRVVLADGRAGAGLIERAMEVFGPPTLALSCPAYDRPRSMGRTSREAVAAFFDDNLVSAFDLCATAADAMAARGGGHILCVMGHVGGAAHDFGQSRHAAACSGMSGLIRAAALELRAKAVSINGIASPLRPWAGTSGPLMVPSEEGVEPVLELLATADHELTGQIVVVTGRKLAVQRATLSAGALSRADSWTVDEIARRWGEIAR